MGDRSAVQHVKRINTTLKDNPQGMLVPRTSWEHFVFGALGVLIDEIAELHEENDRLRNELFPVQ